MPSLTPLVLSVFVPNPLASPNGAISKYISNRIYLGYIRPKYPSHLLPATFRSKPPLSIATLSSLQTQPGAAAGAARTDLFKAQIKSCYSPALISPMVCTVIRIQCKIHSMACKTLPGLALLTFPASSLPLLLNTLYIYLPSFHLTSTQLCYDKQTAY